MGSEIFHTPETMNNKPNNTAAVTLSTPFHAGSSRVPARKDGCAILSSMLLILALFVTAAVSLPAAEIADLLIENAVIYTVNPRQPQATALSVKGSRILTVGPEAVKTIGPQTKRIDAKGGTIIPGMIDSHAHVAALGEILQSFDLPR